MLTRLAVVFNIVLEVWYNNWTMRDMIEVLLEFKYWKQLEVLDR